MISIKSGRKIAGIILIINILFIWTNSALDSEHTFYISDKFTDRVVGFSNYGNTVSSSLDNDEFIVNSQAKRDTISVLVRKAAHFIEFTVLGIMSSIFLLYNVINFRRLRDILILGLCVAFLDETIQIFSHRTPLIQDMWIDLIGFATGSTVVLIVKLLIIKIRKAKI